MVTFVLGALVWSFVAQHLASMAQNTAQGVISDEFKNLLTKVKLNIKVERAVEQAYKQFQSALGDSEMLAALDHEGRFTANNDAARVLAQAALVPQQRETQVSQLTAIMREHTSAMPTPRCERAACLLIDKVHQQITGIRELQNGIMALELQQVREWQERPNFAPGLREGIEKKAVEIEESMGHGYVSTGHLLYAIMIQERSVAAWTLDRLKVSVANVRDALTIIRPQKGGPPGRWSEGAKAALQKAPDLARTRGALDTGTEHVLLALAELALDGGPLGTTIRAVFHRLGIDPQRLYDTSASVAQGQGALVSAIMSFSGTDGTNHGDAARPHSPNSSPNGANGANGANSKGNARRAPEADLPIDARETLRNFGR